MTLFAGNKHSRHILIAAIAVSGIALSIFVFLSSYNKDEKFRQEQFDNAVENRYLALKIEIDNNLLVLESAQVLYISTQDLKRSELMDRVEFRDFANLAMKRHAGIQALEWIPRVPDSERKSYESAARRDGFPDFQFTERISPGKMRRAEQRKEYFPIYFAEPSLGNTPDLGFDLASDTARWTVMERAAGSGEILATGRITLPGKTGNQFGFIVFVPVYQKGALTNTDQARRDNLEGFMLIVFSISDIVEKATGSLKPEGVDFSIDDASAFGEERFLYSHESRLRNTPLIKKAQSEAGYRKTKKLEVAGRQWMISYSASSDFIAAGMDNLHHWELLFACFAVTGLVAAFLFFSGRHAGLMEKSAGDLSNTNAMLAQEMMEHRHAVAQLYEKEHLLSESQRLGHIGSFLDDMRGTIQWSDELYRLYGVSPDTFTPNMDSFINLIYPDDRPVLQAWVRACVAKENPGSVDYRVNMPGGAIRFLRGWGEAVHDDEDKLSYIAGTVQDITEQKHAEDQIRNLNEDLEVKVRDRTQQLLDAQEELVRKEKLALLGQVADSVGHELRNPLGVMNNAVYFLQTFLTDADATTMEYLEIIKTEIDDADRIVSALLYSVRTKPPQPVEVGLGELINLTLHKVNVATAITVTRDIPETLPLVRVDARQMQQVFRNLISNCVEAMPEGGTLAINAVENIQEGMVSVSICDTGCGIPPEVMDKLFQHLVTTKTRGIGLGLVVAKNLTEANGGTIMVESAIGRGTTFTVVLPTGNSAGKES